MYQLTCKIASIFATLAVGTELPTSCNSQKGLLQWHIQASLVLLAVVLTLHADHTATHDGLC